MYTIKQRYEDFIVEENIELDLSNYGKFGYFLIKK